MWFSSDPKKNNTLTSLWKVSKVILNTLDFNQVVQSVVDSLLFELNYLERGYRIIVLTLVDEKTGTLKRVSISQTEEAQKAQHVSIIPFHQIEIPLTAEDNLLIKVIRERKPDVTSYWPDIFTPILTTEQALKNQAAAGIKTSMIYPIIAKERSVGALIFSLIKDINEVSNEEKEILAGFTDLVGLAVQNSSLYTSLEMTTKQLQEANLRLLELDKLKDDFISIASHELRTPMTAIKSYLWMALKRSDAPLTQKMDRYLSRAYISTERLINLVNDMLNVSRIESGSIEISPKEFDILNLANEAVEMIMPKATEKNIKVEVEKEKMPLVFADPDKVTQVLLNLVGNSLKFTPQDGLITINFFTDGKVVEVAVKDSGVGISKDDLSRLFRKFGRLDNSYTAAANSGGTGLGLYISKNLIELMKGKIWASSEGEGKGTTFIFSLPVVSPEVLANAEIYTKKTVGQPKPLEPFEVKDDFKD